MKAYCYPSGLVELGRTTPEGAIEIAQGPSKPMRELMERSLRHGHHDNLLLPGMPEAANEKDKLEALEQYLEWMANRALIAPPTGVTFTRFKRPVCRTTKQLERAGIKLQRRSYGVIARTSKAS